MDPATRPKLTRYVVPGVAFAFLFLLANWGWIATSYSQENERIDQLLMPTAPASPPAAADAAAFVPDGMVRIPAGTFLSGEKLASRRLTLGAFWMDLTETTVERYDACVKANACKTDHLRGHLCNWGRADRNDHPINCVDWHQAKAYCEWTGKRLPTPAEWEYGARGVESSTYPWGESAPATRAGLDVLGCWTREGTCPVGTHAPGKSPFGLLDMAGNVYEWTSIEMRGGSWNGGDDADALRTSLAAKIAVGNVGPHEAFDNELGFRCARSIDVGP